MIALIAHDRRKPELVEFVRSHLAILRSRPLVATGSTGKLLAGELGLEIERVADVLTSAARPCTTTSVAVPPACRAVLMLRAGKSARGA